MLFSSKAIGMEIGKDGLRMALVGGKPDMPRLEAFNMAVFPAETLRFSYREPNVLNPAAFVAKVREAYLPLLTKVPRISLSLPDYLGRVMVMDMETRFKSHEEGCDIIRWKLKKNLPFEVKDIHLDYQLLREKENGGISLLVSLISRKVVAQYEELLAESGLQPNRIDFTTFNICRLFSKRLELTDNGALITFHDGVLSIVIFYDGMADFYRSMEIVDSAGQANRMFLEINSSLLVYRESVPANTLGEVFCLAPPDAAETLRSITMEATGVEPVMLDAERLVTLREGVFADRNTLNQLTAAIGGALRNL